MKWGLPYFNKVFTGGLHANERATFVEGFIRMQLKYDHCVVDQLDLVKKIQSVDRCFDINSKEAFSYYTHPLFRSLKEDFTPYACSMMIHQLIESYKYVAFDDPAGNTNEFTVKTDRSLIFHLTRHTEPVRYIHCDCAFSALNKMICAHNFCLMNAL